LTDDDVPDGLAAVDGAGGMAVAAWVRDLDGDALTRADWTVWASVFEGGVWSAPVEVSAGPGAHFSPTVSVAAAGQAAIAWVHDRDADPSTNDDRRLVYVERQGGTWSGVRQTSGTPNGALSPSVDHDSQARLHFAMLERDKDPGGGQLGLGNRDKLVVAHPEDDGSWASQTLAQGAEGPKMMVDDDELVVGYRSLGPVGRDSQSGELSVARGQLGPARRAAYGKATQLTRDKDSDWQMAMARDKRSRALQTMGRRDPPQRRAGQAVAGATRSAALLPGQSSASDADDPAPLGPLQAVPGSGGLAARQVSGSVDLAVTADAIQLSARHPAAGSPVTITASVLNVGLLSALSGDVTYTDADSGTVLGVVPLAPGIAFGEVFTATLQTVHAGGRHRLRVSVSAPGDDSPANDTAVAELGVLAPPDALGTSASPDGHSVLVSWAPPNDQEVSGAHVTRKVAGQESIVVGVSEGLAIEDTSVQPGGAYTYAVRFYDRYGEVSEEATTQTVTVPAPGRTLHLPMAVKAANVSGQDSMPSSPAITSMSPTCWNGCVRAKWVRHLALVQPL
jgi:hypothetical protein